MKKKEQAQRLKGAEVIVARLGQLDIAGTNNNFGPILSQVINLPRYEPPPSDFKNDRELILEIDLAKELLIDCYFKHFNYYIPILNRKAFMEQLKDREQLETVEVQKLLACVLATGFAFRQEIGDPSVINHMEPNYGTGMCRKFHHFNAQDVFNSSIVNCQCYLILTGFYSSITNYDAVHNLVALAHSISAAQGLNRKKGIYYQLSDKGSKENTADTIEVGHRVFWSVVIVCSGYSLGHQSPFITSNDYDIPYPQRQPSDTHPDFQGYMQDDFEGIKDLGHFVPLYEISSRIADITCTATKQRPHTKVDEVRGMLEEWRKSTLPEELRITPYDMMAIQRQSKFSKFYHAISYMFEISLHHTFQLHESHREMGVHGIWSGYCYDAAVGIKNIYSTRPMTRMNSHVILPVAAGAFANIVASKLLGKEESAQRYCNEIKVMLSGIVRASTSTERIKLMNFVVHGYDNVTQNAEGEVTPFTIETPNTPPSNESSPSQTTTSSPAQTTDVTANSDTYSSGEEEMEDEQTSEADETDEIIEQDKRMSAYFVPSSGQQEFMQQSQADSIRQQQQHQSQQQSQSQAQHHSNLGISPHTQSNPSIYPLSEQVSHEQQHQHQQLQHQRSMVETKYGPSGYSEMVPASSQGPASAGSYSNAGFSPGFSSPYGEDNSEEYSYANRAQLQHRGPNASPLTTTDSGFASTHSQAIDQDAYFAQRHQQNVRQHQSFNACQSMDGGEASQPHQHPLNSAVLSASLDNGLSNLVQGWRPAQEQRNDAHRSKLHEYQPFMTTRNLTQEEVQNLDYKLQQEINQFASAPSSSSSQHFTGGYSSQDQHLLQYQQHQQQQQSGYSSTDISISASLSDSRLLSGGFEGAESMTGLPSSINSFGFTPEDLMQDPQQRFYNLMAMPMASSSAKSFSDPPDLSSSATPSNQQHQQQQSMNIRIQNGSSTFDDVMGYQQQQQQQGDIHGELANQVLQMPSYPDSEQNTLMLEALRRAGALFDPNIGFGISPGGVDIMEPEFENTDSHGGGTGAESLISYLNDPDQAVRRQLFSSVASRNLLMQQNSSQPQQQLHQRPVSYHQHQAR
ncbi:hypothetical protein BGZ54_002194 [Gamsiella multidivaricata]|nr:hypothetical protein BGZ54_002194 [Gamsiella multidivaricata]